MLEKFMAELIGTMILILLGDGVVANVVLKKKQRRRFRMDCYNYGMGFSCCYSSFLICKREWCTV